MPPRPSASWPIGRTVLLIALGWLAFTWPWLSGAVTIPWDAKAHFYPQLAFLARTIHAGESPFWTPNVFSGHPQIADPQSLIFSPAFLLLALLSPEPGFVAADAVTFALLGAGALSVALAFRDRGWHWAGAVTAALVFAFGGSAAWRVQHIGQIASLALVAITFLLLDRALVRRSALYGLFGGLAGAALVLGRDQVALLGCYLLAARVVAFWLIGARRRRRFAGSLPALAMASVVGGAIVALPLLMSVLFGAQSNRPEIDLEGAGRGSLHPVHLLTFFTADLYGSSGPMADLWGPPSFAWSDTGTHLAQNMFVLYAGALPILLVLGGLARGTLLAREIAGATLAAAALLLYALGWYTPVFAAAYHVLPGVGLFRRPADATFLLGALVGVLAGYVLHRMLTAEGWPRPWLEPAIGAAGLGGALAVALAREQADDKAFGPLVTGVAAVALASVLLALVARLGARRATATGLAAVAFVAADLVWSNGPNPSTALPPETYAVLRPDSTDPVIATLYERVGEEQTDTRRDRVELVGLGFEWPNAPLVHDLEHTLGYNPLRIGLYSAATGATDTSATSERRFTPLFPSYRSRLADHLGLRWIVTPEPIEAIDPNLPAGSMLLSGRPGGRYLYENQSALPRVQLVTAAVAAPAAELIATGRWPPSDPHTMVVLERLPADMPRGGEAGRARIIGARNGVVAVEAFAPPGGGFLVLHDVWHPWWYADIDGRPAEILRANVLFRAVRVPEGQSRVRFAFRPVAGALRQLGERLRR
jgi:hypothetical protein